MKLLRIIGILTIIVSVVPVRAQFFDDKSKKEAKDLFEKAKREDSDRVAQVRDLCQAAKMQPKEKKYVDACNSYTAGLNHDDETALALAIGSYQSHDFEKAEAEAKQVSSFDPKMVAKAKTVIDAIHNDKNAGQSVAAVKAAWEHGDFAAVMSLSQDMTTPSAKAAATAYVSDVNMYNAYIEAANKAEKDNPQEAISQLGYAYKLNPNGPVNALAKIDDLNKEIAAKNNSNYFHTQPSGKTEKETKTATNSDSGNKTAPANGPVNGPANGQLSPADTAKKVNGLLADARNAEKQSNTAVALGDYAAVIKLQPDNKEAQTSSARLQEAMKTDPNAATAGLKSAIRSFYNAQFDEAREALMEYIESPQTAQNLGAADFYLGATLIERSVLRTPRTEWKGPSQEALSAFKAARKANYKPVRDYVSPALLKVWDSTAQ
jgi:hypothetical protein